ncbi:MAG: GDP-6-deoxy-D-mannose reductase [candidate division WS2 bacterium]|nr:GDP-6-deoxy-D-mannose reductase [Candidatus Psychracetigena formicireducens]
MRVFVTGGTGFIGTHVVGELQTEENALLLLSRQAKSNLSSFEIRNVDILQGDLSDIDKWKDEVEQFKPQVAVHMAWESLPNYDAKTSKKNLIYGLNLITLLAELGCKSIICTGSCWEYGQQSGKLHEDMILNPSNAFTAAKNALHWLGTEIAKEYDMHFIWTRLFYVYGPGQRETSLIPSIINCVRSGKKPEIKTPSARNDFIYVEDVARAISAIIKKRSRSGVYNIGSGYSMSVQQIIKIVYNEFNLKYSGADAPQNDSVVDFWADISKIETEIGWKRKYTLENGLLATIGWWRKHLESSEETQ